jgi:hypothetical protein
MTPAGRPRAAGAGRAVHRAGAHHLPEEAYPALVDGRVVITDRIIDTAPFVFHGAFMDGCLTRLSSDPLVNVTAGGGSSLATFVSTALIGAHEAAVPDHRHRGRVPDHRPGTRELRSYITEILQEDELILREVKPELHQSIVEVGTTVCQTPAEAREELIRLRGLVLGLAKKKDLCIARPARIRSRRGSTRRSRRWNATSA